MTVPSVIVDYLDLLRAGVGPGEADAVLIVDPDAMLTGSIPGQRLETVARWNPERLEGNRRIETVDLPAGDRPELRGAGSPRGFRVPSVKEVCGAGIGERPDHDPTLAQADAAAV
jgi:hypothetical protein